MHLSRRRCLGESRVKVLLQNRFAPEEIVLSTRGRMIDTVNRGRGAAGGWRRQWARGGWHTGSRWATGGGGRSGRGDGVDTSWV